MDEKGVQMEIRYLEFYFIFSKRRKLIVESLTTHSGRRNDHSYPNCRVKTNHSRRRHDHGDITQSERRHDHGCPNRRIITNHLSYTMMKLLPLRTFSTVDYFSLAKPQEVNITKLKIKKNLIRSRSNSNLWNVSLTYLTLFL